MPKRTTKKVEKVEVVEKVVKVAKKTKTASAQLSIEVHDVKGKVVESVAVSKEIFGAPINKALISQAVRVYLANQRSGTASTKTRGEVQGSSKKIYKQKGTGRARHGTIRAPIFVKGGIVFGPKPRDYGLQLPKNMRRSALTSALSSRFSEKSIKVVSGFEKIAPKTKDMAKALLANVAISKKTKTLFVLPSFDNGKMSVMTKSMRNIEGVTYLPYSLLNTYEVLDAGLLVFTKDALADFQTFMTKGDA